MGEHKRSRPASAYRVNIGREVRRGVTFGLIIAALYCLVALVLFAVRGPRAFESHDITLGAALAVYVGAGTVGGVIDGVLHPLRRSLPGIMLIGVCCAILSFFCIEVATSGLPGTWTTDEWQNVVILGLLFGPICGFIAHKQRWRG